MSQKYVTDGAWLICSEGTMMQKLKVESQTTIYMHGKLAATEIDRTGGNFNCVKMMTMGAIVGAAIAAAAIATTVLTGGAFIGVMATAGAIGSASLAGAVVGKVVSIIPCVCSLLTKPNQWIMPYEKTLLAGKQSLLEDATRPCLLGGVVSIVKTNIQMAINMAMISDDVYYNESNLNNEWERVKEYDDYPQGLNDANLWNDKKKNSGFRAKLYKKEDRYVVAFEGTNPEEKGDIITDVKQGVGLETEQYKKASELAKQIKKYLPPNTIITGHSLGGGLATLVGAKTGLETYTYNSAGVHKRTLERHKVKPEKTNHINAYHSDDDPLNMVQDNRELVLGAFSKLGKVGNIIGSLSIGGALPRTSGQRIGLETDATLLEGHSVTPLIKTLEEEQKVTPTINVQAEKR